jgi:hypothetical protein
VIPIGPTIVAEALEVADACANVAAEKANITTVIARNFNIFFILFFF